MSIKLTEKQEKLLEEHVVDVKFTQVTPRTIFCVLVTKNAWETYGISACKDLNKFDMEKGQKYAFLHAVTRLEYEIDNNKEV